MYPVLFHLGPFPVYSFGLMMATGFIVASYVLTKELERRGFEKDLGSHITLLALVFGIAGSKLLYLIENWDEFMRQPSIAFSPGGLTFYGGFILATLAIFWYARSKKIPFLQICDAAAPPLLIAYGIARVGCHLSGDGDYGLPTDLPWASVYSAGTYPPSAAFRMFPEIVQKYGVNGVVPDDILVHPTPLYEFAICLVFFFALVRLRKQGWPTGKLFMLYLILSGAERFFVEFLRLNPRMLFGLSEAQLIAAVLVGVGVVGMVKLRGPGEPGVRIA